MMKKILLSIFATAMTAAVCAQGFYKAVELGGAFGIDTYKNNSAEALFVAGYSVSHKFMVGAGVGFRYTDALYYTSYNHISGQIFSNSYESRSQEYLIPIQLRIKYNFIDKLVSPFVQGSAGYTVDTGKTHAVGGLCFEPAVGVDFNISDEQSIYFSVSMNFQRSQYKHFTITSYENSENTYHHFAEAISIKVGFKF